MRKLTMTVAALAFGLTACGSPETADDTAPDTATPAEPTQATATLQTADGEPAGTVQATANGAGITIALNVRGIEPGEHGVHVHTTGSCEAPDFASAGGHWNPAGTQHGLDNPEGPHAGDMPNLTVGEDGTGTLEYQLVGGTFDGLLDADGSAFIVHAGRDDQTTDPSGDSGDRVACGVFAAG